MDQYFLRRTSLHTTEVIAHVLIWIDATPCDAFQPSQTLVRARCRTGILVANLFHVHQPLFTLKAWVFSKTPCNTKCYIHELITLLFYLQRSPTIFQTPKHSFEFHCPLFYQFDLNYFYMASLQPSRSSHHFSNDCNDLKISSKSSSFFSLYQ